MEVSSALCTFGANLKFCLNKAETKAPNPWGGFWGRENTAQLSPLTACTENELARRDAVKQALHERSDVRLVLRCCI